MEFLWNDAAIFVSRTKFWTEQFASHKEAKRKNQGGDYLSSKSIIDIPAEITVVLYTNALCSVRSSKPRCGQQTLSSRCHRRSSAGRVRGIASLWHLVSSIRKWINILNTAQILVTSYRHY